MIQPMLANPLEIGKATHAKQWQRVIDGGYTMEPKLDGMRLLLVFNSKGELHRAFTRSGRNVLEQVPLAWRMDVHAWTLRDATLDCEFGYTDDTGGYDAWPLIDFNMTMRVMGSGPEEAQRKAAEHDFLPVAHVFDIQDTFSHSWTQQRRRAYLEEIVGSTDLGKLIEMVPDWGLWDDERYTEYVNLGGEGIMLKNPWGTYVSAGRPTQTWYKVKKFATADVVILGFEPGQGKYAGQIGAIRFGVHKGGGIFTPVGQCSGMTDEMRQHITDNQRALMGKVIEIRYFGYTAGTPRHPQFVRFRLDKTPMQCGKEQLGV